MRAEFREWTHDDRSLRLRTGVFLTSGSTGRQQSEGRPRSFERRRPGGIAEESRPTGGASVCDSRVELSHDTFLERG